MPTYQITWGFRLRRYATRSSPRKLRTLCTKLSEIQSDPARADFIDAFSSSAGGALARMMNGIHFCLLEGGRGREFLTEGLMATGFGRIEIGGFEAFENADHDTPVFVAIQ